jgi:hypothetical protein
MAQTHQTGMISENMLITRFRLLEQILGYKFQHHDFLIQAFTHISFRQTINKVLYFKFNERNLFSQPSEKDSAPTPTGAVLGGSASKQPGNQGGNQSAQGTNEIEINMSLPNVVQLKTLSDTIERQSTFLNKLNPDEFSYDRLEFLGDAIFDLIIVRYLYDAFPGEDPSKSTSLCAGSNTDRWAVYAQSIDCEQLYPVVDDTVLQLTSILAD